MYKLKIKDDALNLYLHRHFMTSQVVALGGIYGGGETTFVEPDEINPDTILEKILLEMNFTTKLNNHNFKLLVNKWNVDKEWRVTNWTHT